MTLSSRFIFVGRAIPIKTNFSGQDLELVLSHKAQGIFIAVFIRNFENRSQIMYLSIDFL